MTPQQVQETLDQEFTCTHEAVVLTRKIAANQVVHFANQCARCGMQLGGFQKKANLTAEAMKSAPDFDHSLSEAFYEQRRSRREELWGETEFQSRSGYNRAFYEGYLLTPAWQEKRRLVFQRARGVCEGCRQKPATEVHHMTYERLGHEMLFDLRAVCRECHEAIHENGERAPCERCDDSGLVSVYRRPPVPVGTPANVNAHCVCPMGRWMRKRIGQQTPGLLRRIPDLRDILDGRSVWQFEPSDDFEDDDVFEYGRE